MKILFLTDNFPPETNAPAIRTLEHVREWAKLGHQVEVITGVPNFPTGKAFPGYKNRLLQRSRNDGVDVTRVWTYIAANKGLIKRTIDYISFMVSAFLASFYVQRPDVVVATSPQFFTAVAGWATAKAKRCPFVFELRDFWPETIVAVGAMRRGVVTGLLEKLARFLYHQANLMVPVTPAFAEHLRTIGIPAEKIQVVTNGISPSALAQENSTLEVRQKYNIPQEAFVTGYIGTLGMCQGLDVALAAANELSTDQTFHFVLLGEGADKDRLMRIAEEKSMSNVTFIDRKPHNEALAVLGAVDASLVVLADDPVFREVIPSKIFEAMALSKPIVLGVRGEVHRIVVEESHCGIAFTPGDAMGLVACLKELERDSTKCEEFGRRGREAVIRHYLRPNLAQNMLAALKTLTERDRRT